MDSTPSECTACTPLASCLVSLHCVHFDGKVIHWHEAGDGGPNSVCGPDYGMLDRGGATVHMKGEANFSNASEAKAEFTRRAEALRVGV